MPASAKRISFLLKKPRLRLKSCPGHDRNSHAGNQKKEAEDKQYLSEFP
jgi:hypothetical protein